MKRVAVKTTYTYELDNEYIKFMVGHVEGVPIVEVYSGTTLIYYKPLTEVEIKMESDFDLIKRTVETMNNSKSRWFDNKLCTWLSINFTNMRYKERNTVYEFEIDGRAMYM